MEMMPAILSQQSYRCRLDWGRDGVRRAAARRDVVVVVDVLRFSTAVVTAVQRGALIYPCGPSDDSAALARRVGAEVAAYRPDMAETQRYSLSPGSYDGVPPGTRVVLPSPNGAACSRFGREAPYLFAGALVNAAAVGSVVSALVSGADLAVTVVACGERWPEQGDDGALRFAVEDYLGAGAILASLGLDMSPEARVCAAAFVASRGELAALLRDSTSGHELRHKGWGADVERAAQVDLYDAVPVLRQERFEPYLGGN
jgi:2-phosphosulfolactate phosphatase